jgi:hypothetical protein
MPLLVDLGVGTLLLVVAGFLLMVGVKLFQEITKKDDGPK